MLLSRRHRKSHLKTRVARRISEVSAEAWDRIYRNSLEGHSFYKSLDESSLTQFSLYYILVYDNRRLVGAAPCFLLRYSFDTSLKGLLKKILIFLKKFNPNVFSVSAIACGAPADEGAIGVEGDDARIFRAILKRLEQLAKKKKASVVAFKDFRREYGKFLDPLQDEGFVKISSLPATEMHLNFKDFEGYLKSLSGASRYDLRRKFKKVDGKVKIDLEITDTLTDKTLVEIYGLYMQIVKKHEMGFEILPIEFFRRISENMRENAKFFFWRIDGKMAAFLFALVSKDVFSDYYLGLDYSMAHKYHLYFVKFRDAFNWAIKHGIKRYDMGITGYEPKRRLGFGFVPLYIYAKYRNPFVRPLFNILCGMLKFENFDPVLKEINREARLVGEKG